MLNLGKIYSNQKGLSLIEIFIVLVFMGGLLLSVNLFLVPWMKDLGEQRNKDDMAILVKEIEKNFKTVHYWSSEVQNTATPGAIVMSTSAVVVPSNDVITDSLGRRVCPEGDATFNALSRVLNRTAESIRYDGFKNSICIFMGSPLQGRYLGYDFTYSNIYILSPGKDGVVQAVVDKANNIVSAGQGSFASGTFNANVSNDDVLYIISGLDVYKKSLEKAIRNLDFVGEAYAGHFTSQFLSEISRDYTTNYFCRPTTEPYCVNAGNPVQADVLASLFRRAGSFNGVPSEMQNPFPGAPIAEAKMFLINDAPTKTQPPFFATLFYTTPSGVRIEKTVSGAY